MDAVNRYGWEYYISLDGAFNFNDNLANGRKTAISIPTILDSGYGTDMASAASGAYDQYYAQLAQNLAPYCSQIVSFAIDWEFNGYWFNHGVENSDGSLRWQPSDFIAAHRRLTNSLRQYCPGVPIIWPLNNGPESNLPSGYAAEQFYPGDAYVDAIGLDLYEQNYSSFAAAQSNGGFNWIDSFSSQHGKGLAFPEWQATNGDASFIASPLFYKVFREK
jgi:beta-mannanase